MCKHDIINIQHSHCSPVGPTAESSPERPLPETGIFTRQSQGCVSASLAASAWRRHRATSELMCKYDVIHKREIRNVSLRRQRTTEQWPQVTCSKIWWWPDVWFRRYNDRRQTNADTDRHAHHNTPPPIAGGVISHNFLGYQWDKRTNRQTEKQTSGSWNKTNQI